MRPLTNSSLKKSWSNNVSKQDELLTFAHELANIAREITLCYFRQPLAVEGKNDGSPVTLADKKTEATLRERIEQRYPEHGIIGEEQAQKTGNSRYEWILDPIDGTRSFISGYPLYGTLICLLHDGLPMVSLIDMPALDERFYACSNSGTYYRKRQYEQIITAGCADKLTDAMLFSTDYGMFSKAENKQAQPLRRAVSLVRYNGDCYLYAMLAAGWIDIVLEADLKIYDFLPLKLIVEQAGGMITDWQGRPLSKNSNGQILAAGNSKLHEQALSILNQH